MQGVFQQLHVAESGGDNTGPQLIFLAGTGVGKAVLEFVLDIELDLDNPTDNIIDRLRVLGGGIAVKPAVEFGQFDLYPTQ